MPTRTKVQPRIVAKDVNEWAAKVISASTGTPIPTGVLDAERKKIRNERLKAALRKVEALKNPAAVALGRLGGLKGGKARAEALTPSQRSKIAKKAAQMRWTREIEAKLKPKTEEKTVSPAAKRGKSVKSPEPSAV